MVLIYNAQTRKLDDVEKVWKDNDDWKKILSEQEYLVARKKGTEPAFTGKYHDFHGNGLYKCVCCGTDLFSSETKFDSGTGWPSFFAPVDLHNIVTVPDLSFGMNRSEVLCARCDAHLGHVFDDGPSPTFKRYCMNSASLAFAPLE